MKIFQIYDFNFKGNPEFITLSKGVYIFECWGAAGHNLTDYDIETNGTVSLARGGYVKGYIQLNKTTTFYIYVGEKGNQRYNPVFNGNNDNTVIKGGGATDIRLIGGDWFLFDSLKSRIIVAGAGGSGERYFGGDGGGLNGTSNYPFPHASPGTQTSGGIGQSYWASGLYYGHGSNGSFGRAGNGYCHDKDPKASCDYGPGGGSGYYGGGGMTYLGSGGGGSSFISGHPGCDAITKDSTSNNIIHTGQPNHYSKLVFYNTEMFAGNQEFMSPDHKMGIGHLGNGFARITRLTPFFQTCRSSSRCSFIFIYYLSITIVK